MPILYKEQLPIEIRPELLKESARKAFQEGVSYTSVIQRFTTIVYPSLMERITALESAQTDLLLPRLFLLAKRAYFETRAWIELNFEIFKEVTKSPTLKEEGEIEALLKGQLERINQLGAQVLQSASGQFPLSYAEQLDRIEREIDKLLIDAPEKLTDYSDEQRGVYFEGVKTSKGHLRQMVHFIVRERPKWFKELMGSGRGLYLSFPEQWPYPVIYTIHNALYIPLEIPEHFLGIGEGKIICRTIDLDQGKMVALVKPRTLFSAPKNTEVFDFAWRESNFLMKLQGKKGVIEVVERAVFEMNGTQHLFLFEEKYENGNLFNLVKQLDFKAKVAVTRCVLQGLTHIHEANIVHRDLKPQNVLVDLTNSKNPKAVICDFNVALYLNEPFLLEQHAFSPIGCPPEYALAMLSTIGKNIARATTQKLDIWAAGILLGYIFCEILPPWLDQKDMVDTLAYLAKLPRDWYDTVYPDHIFSPLIKKMLSVDLRERPSAIEAYEEFTEVVAKLQHPPKSPF